MSEVFFNAERTVLIMAAAEGFIIKGLETKLQGIGVRSVYSGPMMRDLKGRCDHTDLIVIFTDEDTAKHPDALVYIKDHCDEHNERVIVVGAKAEYEILTKYIHESLIYSFFERPLDMSELVSAVEKYLEAESQMERRKSVLIVDDDVSYMSIIMDWLKDKYRVSLANSGMEAIIWLAKNKADLILLDYEMPITDGPQVLEMIRSSPATADIPVMFLTGKSDKDSIMRVLSLKPAGYLLKSVDRGGLRKSIEEFFATQIAQKP